MATFRIPEHARRHPSVWWSRFKIRWPLVCWLLAVAAVVYLYYHGGRFSGMSGTVQAVRDLAAPLETARLRDVRVIVGQEVRAGDVLAEMDTSILDAEMVMEKLQEERRFASAVAQIDTRLQEARIREAEAVGELAVLDAELERMDDLLAKRLIDAQSVTRLRARQQALKSAVELYPGVIRNLETELENARNRMRTVAAWFGEGGETNASADWKADEEIQRQFSLLELRRNAYTLRAKADGVVSRVDYKPGDIVNSGDTVVALVLKGSAEVVGFLPESNSRYVSIGMTSYLSRVTGKGPIIPARVIALTPEIMGLPNRANPFPGMDFRGRQVILRPLVENDLIHGESVSIDLDKPTLTLSIGRLFDYLAARGRKEP